MVTRAECIHCTHGGAATLCRRNSTLNFSEVFIDTDCDFVVAATLQNFFNSVALFILFHLPPTTSSLRITFFFVSSCFEDCVGKAKGFYPPDIFNMSLIVLGDFNFPDLDWSSMYSTNRRELEFPENVKLLEFLRLITNGRTCCRKVLDTFVTHDNLITGYSIEDNSLFDHSSITFNYSSEAIQPYQHPSEYSLNNHTKMVNFLESWEDFSFTLHPSEPNVREFCLFVTWSLISCFCIKRKVRKKTNLFSQLRYNSPFEQTEYS